MMWFVSRRRYEAVLASGQATSLELMRMATELSVCRGEVAASGKEIWALRAKLTDEQNASAELRGRLMARAHAEGLPASSEGL